MEVTERIGKNKLNGRGRNILKGKGESALKGGGKHTLKGEAIDSSSLFLSE